MLEQRKGALTPEEEIAFNENELNKIERELEELRKAEPIGYINKKMNSLRPKAKTDIDEPVFLNPSSIKAKDRNLKDIIPSGVDSLDQRIIGFNKGELTIWSGSNGAGKSSILSQLSLAAIDNGFKVAMFSGELSADRVMNWITLQASGKAYAMATKYENYYTIPDNFKSKINQWLDNKLYIYNNNYGTNVLSVIEVVEKCIDDNKIDVLVMDNIMALNLGATSSEKYERQTDLVLRLSQLAKDKKVHIHLVAHPRKSVGFLRKTDISGTADITNAADNVILAHRVNNDFKRNIKEFLGIKDDNPMLRYDNVIEVAKNRDLGVSDLFIGLYFEKESKRFLNTNKEIKRYGWEKDKEGFANCINENIPFI